MPDLTSPNYFADFIGSFWNLVWGGKKLTSGIAAFSSAGIIQQYQWFVEAVDRLSIDTVHPTATELSRPLIIRQSKLSEGPDFLKFGGGEVFGPQPSGTKFRAGATFEYGGLERRSGRYYTGIDSKIVSVGPVMMNSLKSPSLVLVSGVDYTCGDGIITFKSNPFDDPRIPQRTVSGDDGEGEDVEIVLWMTDVQTDSGEFSQHFGFVAPKLLPSTPEYFEAIRACMRGVAEGPTLSAIDFMIAATLGLPCVREARETVLSVSSFGDDTLVATDLGVYLVKNGFSVRSEVVPGAVLESGHPLSTGSEVFDRTSNVEWWSDLDGIAIGESFFDKRISSALGFLNAVYPVILGAPETVEYETNWRGASFYLSGKASDVDLFWKIAHDNSFAQQRPIGNELYKQEGLVDEDGAPDFDKEMLVNPLQFLATKLIKDSVVVIRIRNSTKLPLRNLFQVMTLMKNLLPPWLGMIIVSDIQVSEGLTLTNDAYPLSSVTVTGTENLLPPSLDNMPAEWSETDSNGDAKYPFPEAVSVDRSPDLQQEIISFGDPSGNVDSYGQSIAICEESVEPHLKLSCMQ